MKKLSYLIILTLILGLVLTGCLLSNVGQVPSTGQSGVAYLTKGPLPADLIGLVGLWHFDKGSGDAAYDSSGTIPPNNGTLVGDTDWTSGMFGQALSFDNYSDYVDCGDDASFNFEDKFTVEAWINLNVIPGYYDIIVNRAYGNWMFAVHAGKLEFGEHIWYPGTGNRRIYSDVVLWEVGQWYHVAVVYDTIEMKADFYLDGVSIGTGRQSSIPGGIVNSGNVVISGPGLTGFNGLIDEVRIWDGALTAEQIADSANHGIVIQKGVSQDDVFLGDTVTITLEVVTAHESVTITDTLPDELHYIPDTFMVGNDSATPEVDEQTISYTLDEPCAYTITFDAQVTSAEADDIKVINTATATATEGEVSASAELTIHPYEGFTKVADGEMTVEVGEEIEWNVAIAVTNIPGDEITFMSDIVVQDRFGGELEIDNDIVDEGELEIKLSGKTEKPKIKWDNFSLDENASATAVLDVSTDINPGGHQSYSTAGEYEMNSGAVLKFIDSEGTGFQLSAHTPQITVVVE